MVRLGLSPVLVGRGAEVDRLDRALDGSQVLLITGEAGSGKTRLVRELVERAERRATRAYLGRCIDLGAEIWPLAPLREIAAAVLDDLGEDGLERVAGRSADVMRRLVAGADDPHPFDPSVAGDVLIEQVLNVCVSLAREAPLLLVLEDLHWADDTTRTVFAALARSSRLERTLLAGTFRPDELTRRHPLRAMLAEVDRQAACERIELRPLSRDATEELVDAITGHPMDRALVDRIHVRSGGNAFFVEELISAAERDPTRLPSSVRDAILARTVTLGDAAHEVLDVIAAAGATTLDVVADVAVLHEADVRDIVDELCASCLLVCDGDELRFRHELAREVFDEELLPGHGSQIHALATSLQRRRPDRLGAVARHWAAAHDTTNVLAASVAAGRQAYAVGAAAEAEDHFERALAMWSRVVDAPAVAGLDHVTLLLEAAAAADHARHVDRAIALDLAAVDQLDGAEAVRAAQIWLHLRQLYRWHNRFAESADAVSRALDLLEGTPPSATVAVALAHGAHDAGYAGRRDEADEMARRAIEVAGAVGDVEAIVRAHYAMWGRVYAADDHERALAIAETNVARCGSHAPTDLTLSALNCLRHSLVAVGRITDSVDVARRGVELARTSGLGGPLGPTMATYWLEGLTMLGRWHELELVADDVRDLTNHPAEAGSLAGTLGSARIRQGRLDEARPHIEDARSELQRIAWSDNFDYLVASVAMFDAADGHLDDALALIDRQLQQPPGFSEGVPMLVAVGVGLLADAAAGSHRPPPPAALDQASAWVRLLTPVDAVTRAATWAQADCSRARAEHARLRGQADAAAWTDSATRWAALGAAYEEAAARLHLAEALFAGSGGRAPAARAAARAELVRAHGIAVRIPAPPLAEAIQNIARRAGVDLERSVPGDRPQAAPDGLSTLTRRELDVLELLATGRTNGQIATTLYISTKTASVHVSNILRKLGVANRVEAAAFAHRVKGG